MERRKPRVLIVSENASVREGCLRALSQIASPRTASFMEGLRRLGRADAVVADMSGLPLSGIAFLRYLQMEYPDLPLVLLQGDEPPTRLPCNPRTAWLTLPVRATLLQGLVGAMCPGALSGSLRPAPAPRTPPA